MLHRATGESRTSVPGLQPIGALSLRDSIPLAESCWPASCGTTSFFQDCLLQRCSQPCSSTATAEEGIWRYQPSPALLLPLHITDFTTNSYSLPESIFLMCLQIAYPSYTKMADTLPPLPQYKLSGLGRKHSNLILTSQCTFLFHSYQDANLLLNTAI